MAGKSTFLRTIGANLILAMAGMPVMAEKFSF
jgi:DNA mismatch repair ATPase MutS